MDDVGRDDDKGLADEVIDDVDDLLEPDDDSAAGEDMAADDET